MEEEPQHDHLGSLLEGESLVHAFHDQWLACGCSSRTISLQKGSDSSQLTGAYPGDGVCIWHSLNFN